MKKSLIFTLFAGIFVLGVQATDLPAFPGAEGFGRYAIGGRNGSVYHVTTLSDSGVGSLRDAVSAPNRIIIFDVSGVIRLQSRLVFSPNLYVAGQTAPGEGITVYGNGVSFSGANNIIVRYIRFRMGSDGDSGKDAAGVSNGTDMIFDHLSVSWGLDETFSINSDGKGSLGDITIQNSIMSQGLMTHSAGGLMQADHITLYRNLYVDNSTRNNKIKGTNQYVNNIVYNWKNGCYLMGGDSEGLSYCNATNNLFINGPAVGGNAFTGGNANFHIYASDNWQDKNRDGSFNPYLIPNGEYSGPPTIMNQPYDYPVLPAWNGNELIDSLLPIVGASLPYRDPVDFYVIGELRSFGKEGALISKESQLPLGIPTSWKHKSFARPLDSDGDGMPDAWELANDTDPSKDDAMVKAANGYANIENYINSIRMEDREFFLRVPFCLSLEESSQNSLTINWRDYAEGEEGYVVEQLKGSEYMEIVRIPANDYRMKSTSNTAAGPCAGPYAGSVRYTVSSLKPATAYSFRVRAYHSEKDVYSDYAQLADVKTQLEYVPMIELSSYAPDFTWAVASGAWNTSTDNWIEGLYQDSSSVLIAPETDVTLTVESPVAPSDVVVAEDHQVTFAGSAIGGKASMNKFGKGSLDMGDASHDYTGATALHEGTVRITTLKDGSVPSSIGASQDFAQNWIWDGGVWQYTGGNTSTNRNAKIYRTTTFEQTTGSTVTMTGSLEGNGGLVLRGGQVTVGNTNFFAYSGETRLEEASTLYLSTTDISKKGIGSSSALVLAGGTLKTKGESSSYETYNFPIRVEEGFTSVIAPNRNCSIASKISGSGNLRFKIPYVREYVTGNWDDFDGRLIADGVGTEKDGTQLMLYNGTGIRNAVVELRGNTRVICWKAGATYRLGGLAGTSETFLSGGSKNTDNTTMTWIVGGANTDETFAGVIDNRCSATGHNCRVNIVKEGRGDWRLTGKNIYSGTTTINEGRLVVNGSLTGTGAITVNDGGTLSGKGSVAGRVTASAGGRLQVGDTLFSKTDVLTLNGGAVLNSGSVIEVPLYRKETLNNCPKIKFGANSTLNGTLRLDMTEVSIAIPENSSFAIFSIPSGVTLSGSIKAVEPEIPAPGQKWDLSQLLTTGKIYIRSESYTGLKETLTEPEYVEYFDLAGQPVSGASDGCVRLLLKRSIYQDGKVKVKKVMMR